MQVGFCHFEQREGHMYFARALALKTPYASGRKNAAFRNGGGTALPQVQIRCIFGKCTLFLRHHGSSFCYGILFRPPT